MRSLLYAHAARVGRLDRLVCPACAVTASVNPEGVAPHPGGHTPRGVCPLPCPGTGHPPVPLHHLATPTPPGR